jgi:hypothetical protein
LILTLLGGLTVTILLVVFFSTGKNTAHTGKDPVSPVREGGTTKRMVAAERDNRSLIQSVRLEPEFPTRTDVLHAVVTPVVDIPADQLQYSHTWKVNEQTVKNTTGGTLDLSPFRKGDLVYVTVTPYRSGTAGYAARSPMIALQAVPPSLELNIHTLTIKAGGSCILQLSSSHPDSEGVEFGLEEPKVNGMTIDARTGRILWIVQPDQPGVVNFGASVTDSEGTRVTKRFEIKLQHLPAQRTVGH